MKKRIIVGTSDFRHFIEDHGYFVDKTLFIKDILDTGNQVVVLPRPRRFGKTLNLSMLRHYFDASLDNTAPLFEPYKI